MVADPTLPRSSASETVASLIARGTKELAASGIGEPRREARLLLNIAFGLTTGWQLCHADEVIANAVPYDRLLERRAHGEPVAYLSGKQGFWTLDLAVSPETLIPRADTETLIEALLSQRPERESVRTILDLGTGTGCLLLAALSEYPLATGIGVDRIQQATILAADNARLNNLEDRCSFAVSQWNAAIAGRFDVILSNPPYIPSGDIPGLMRDVADYEPVSALDGGTDGLDDYRILIPALNHLLAPDGVAIFEIGIGQDKSVPALGCQAGLRVVEICCDHGGHPRAVIFAA
ncbi:peptide chain release factor N(5)-glutamine methyltransferase [Acetobacter oeni]|nr:peptide chain release factor N(5)-glutamine methyltransferase [Acetobacter oeni]NHO18093.1 peptide chain release factor N(5)-glutamine methyltransferase [Acetobacter oeni]